MPTTPRGLWYPDSADDVRPWEDMQALAESVEAALDDVSPSGPMTAFTLTQGGGSGITFGNSTQDCAYQLLGDKTARFRIELILGSTGAVTATAILGPLPFTVKGGNQIVAAWWYKSSTVMRAGVASLSGTQVNRVVLAADSYWDATAPAADAPGDTFRCGGTVELA